MHHVFKIKGKFEEEKSLKVSDLNLNCRRKSTSIDLEMVTGGCLWHIVALLFNVGGNLSTDPD